MRWRAPRAYDLISLTEDARRDVSPELAERTVTHYFKAARDNGAKLDEAGFRAEMALMAAQRNAKIVGIFARLYKRDAKPRYLALLPPGVGSPGARPGPSGAEGFARMV